MKAFILRIKTVRAPTALYASFSNTYGRVLIGCPSRGAPSIEFSLIECFPRVVSQELVRTDSYTVLDSFATIRDLPYGARILLLFRDLVEQCLPPGAPAPHVWLITEELLSTIHLFSDWKTPVLFLALSLLAQEGLPYESLKAIGLNSSYTTALDHCLQGNVDDALSLKTPEPVLKAALSLLQVYSKVPLQ